MPHMTDKERGSVCDWLCAGRWALAIFADGLQDAGLNMMQLGTSQHYSQYRHEHCGWLPPDNSHPHPATKAAGELVG